MAGLLKKLIYICIGIFVLVDLSFRLNLPGADERAGHPPNIERRARPRQASPSPAPRPITPDQKTQTGNTQGVQPWRRGPGPKIWARQTTGWGPGDAVSKIHEFPDYRAPVNPRGRIKSRQRGGGSSSGTAFAIAPNGVWLTAAHVVEGCSAIFVEAGLKGGRAKRLRASRVTLHPGADGVCRCFALEIDKSGKGI